MLLNQQTKSKRPPQTTIPFVPGIKILKPTTYINQATLEIMDLIIWVPL